MDTCGVFAAEVMGKVMTVVRERERVNKCERQKLKDMMGIDGIRWVKRETQSSWGLSQNGSTRVSCPETGCENMYTGTPAPFIIVVQCEKCWTYFRVK